MNLSIPKTKQAVGQLDAREVFDKIVESAWRNGEPGIIFWIGSNRDNVVPSQGEIESTNPCGERPLSVWVVQPRLDQPCQYAQM